MMAHLRFVALVALALWTTRVCAADDSAVAATSPDGQVKVRLFLTNDGQPRFETSYSGRPAVRGALGLAFAGTEPLVRGLKIVGVDHRHRDQTYSVPVGKASSIRDHCEEMVVTLADQKDSARKLKVVFRAYDDGIAFRYEVPRDKSHDALTLLDELTELTFPDDPIARVLPLDGYSTPYETYYETGPLSAIRADTLIGLPALFELSAKGATDIWIAVTEANLTDYAGMYLASAKGRPDTLVAKLSPLPGRTDGAKVVARSALTTPWRVLMMSNRLEELLESNLIFNLNAPSRIADPSWIKPGRTTFPWWNGYVLEGVDFKPGLNTATYKHYIDFCAKYGIEYHTLDGTDTAWYGGPIVPDGPTDVTKSVPEIDMPELLRYAQEKHVQLRLWMHWRALRPQLDEALATYEKWGIEGIMVDFMDRDDQEMVAFYHEVAQKAAEHHLTVTWHGAYKPTGMERTWPNVLNYEAALNQEYNKWSKIGTPPAHNLNIALVRSLAGPVDYHLGGMRNVMPDDLQVRESAPEVQGTRAHQLAMYVVYENHLPMLADYPEAYEGQAGFDFLTGVPTNWDETRVLTAKPDRCVVVARRRGKDWYLGGMTGNDSESIDVPLSFLGAGNFDATLLLDVPSGRPTDLDQRNKTVDAADALSVEMSRGGGFVATIRPD